MKEKSNFKIFSILFSLGAIAITIVLLLVFLLPKQNSDELVLTPNKTITSSINDISLSVGNKIYDYYEISDKSAEFSFTLDKQGIINIDKEKIEGLKVGEVNVKMIAKTKTSSTSIKFKVVVCAGEYTFNFQSISSCTFENDNINISSNAFQFKIEVLSKTNTKMENIEFNIVSNKSNTIIDKSFSSIMVVTNEDCILTFIFPEIDVTFSKFVKIGLN